MFMGTVTLGTDFLEEINGNEILVNHYGLDSLERRLKLLRYVIVFDRSLWILRSELHKVGLLKK